MLEYYGYLWQGQALSELWPSAEESWAAKSYTKQLNSQQVIHMCGWVGESVYKIYKIHIAQLPTCCVIVGGPEYLFKALACV